MGLGETGGITMKRLSFIFDALRSSVLCVVLLLSVIAVGFASCGDDDNEEEGSLAGAPYTGVWEMNYIKIEGDGEGSGEGPITSEWGECRLSLLEDHTGNYYCLTHDNDEEDGEDALINQNFKWSFAGNKLTLEYTGEYAGARAEITVLSWTATKLITYQSEEGYKETRTFVKR